GVLRLEVDAARFHNWKSVHVRANEQTRPTVSGQIGDDARPGDACARGRAGLREVPGDYLCGSRFLERELRVAVEIAARLDESLKFGFRKIRQQVVEAGCRWHAAILQNASRRADS